MCQFKDKKIYVENLRKKRMWKNEYVERGCWRVNPEVQYLDKDMANMLCCYVSTSPTC